VNLPPLAKHSTEKAPDVRRRGFSIAWFGLDGYDNRMGVSWKQWAEQARYDLDTARAMLDAGRYLYVVFCCQQAVEKILKALIAQRSKELPPRIHQLVRLA
jgi:hypothetical protein